jgi:hypothetical protein
LIDIILSLVFLSLAVTRRLQAKRRCQAHQPYFKPRLISSERPYRMALTQRFSANWPRKMTLFFHPLERTIVKGKSTDVHLGICLTQYASDIVTISGKPSERWTLNVYIYVTNVPPTDPDWKAKGGRVFILIKHGGNFPRQEKGHGAKFDVRGTEGGVKVRDHQPNEYDRKEGDDYICTCLFPLYTQVF